MNSKEQIGLLRRACEMARDWASNMGFDEFRNKWTIPEVTATDWFTVNTCNEALAFTAKPPDDHVADAGKMVAEELEKAMFSVRQFCGAHVGIDNGGCPACQRDERRKVTAPTLDIRAAMEAHAEACRVALREIRPRPEMPNYLSGAILRGADLSGANLRGAILSDAKLIDANLRGADLSDANLRGADLRYAYLRGANLIDADLRGAYLRDAYLSDAKLIDANLRGADLRGADLRGANLIDANLSGADLRGADLSDAKLIDANLRGADLSDANLSEGVKVGDHIQVGPIGSRRSLLTAILGRDGSVTMLTGCFRGTLDEFTASVGKTHVGTKHFDDYTAAIAMIRHVFALNAGGKP